MAICMSKIILHVYTVPVCHVSRQVFGGSLPLFHRDRVALRSMGLCALRVKKILCVIVHVYGKCGGFIDHF